MDLTNDASRSAIAALRYLRANDPESAVALVATLDERECGAFAGACLAIASAALSVCDQLSEAYSRATGAPAARADDILGLLTLAHVNEEFGA